MILGLSLAIAALVWAVILLNVKLKFVDKQVCRYQGELDSCSRNQESLCSTISGLRESLSNANNNLSSEKRGFNEEKHKLEQSAANLSDKLEEESEARKKILSQKKSGEVRLGHIAEKLAPFLKDFAYDPSNATFLGQPIDYIVFEDEEIVFVEIKSGNAKLSSKQKHIKELIENNCVSWKEIRID